MLIYTNSDSSFDLNRLQKSDDAIVELIRLNTCVASR